ncbi:MAG: hypothetical protein K6T16_03045 [Candidatus Pacearchaeota archaeon]|nr:hypothetical protein [Candidatus Pacearchaeota archaeon]
MAKKEEKGGGGAINLLLDNTIALQKTLTTIAAELKVLNSKVSGLLALFEEASKSFKEGKPRAVTAIPPDLTAKMEGLVRQNKTIARGLLLLEKTIRESKETKQAPEGYKPKPLPEFSF